MSKINEPRVPVCKEIKALLKMLEKIDVIPVIRCKDCKWYGMPGCAIEINTEADKPGDDDYCSFGERKKDDETD